MARRHLLFVLIAVAAAAFFVRLGLWQLSRLRERRARNAVVASRFREPPVPLRGLPADTGLARYRRVTLSGEYDYAHEIVLTNRAREGSPGVYLVTPLRVAGSDTAVLVTRGWVYSPDGTAVDASAWREPSGAPLTGFVEPMPTGRRGSPVLPHRPNALRWLSEAEVSRHTGYPVTPYTVVLLADSLLGNRTPPTAGTAARDSTPPRISPPALDEGPHLGYAIQWFSFAAIALGGAAAYVFTQRRKQSAGRG